MSTEANVNNSNNIKDDETNDDNDNNVGGGGEPRNRPACAACKYNRKKCVKEECAMWNHFPAHKAEQFAAVQKIFGLKNLTKNIKDLNEQQQEEAIRAFEWEAMCWKDDPVHGPLGQYRKLDEANRQLMTQYYRVEQDNILLRHQLSIIQQQVPVMSPQNIGSRMLPPGPQQGHGNFMHNPNNGGGEGDFLTREQGGHNVRLSPLRFQGPLSQQIFPFDQSQNSTGPSEVMGLGRNHLRWNNNNQIGSGMYHTHAIPNHQHNLGPSPIGYTQQITTPGI